jgi:hemerythrin-like domain-containing protein
MGTYPLRSYDKSGAMVDVLDIIRSEHREAEAMLDKVEGMDPDDKGMADLATQIETALSTHLAIEERLFYARLRERAEQEEMRVDVFEAYTEHEVARHLIALLRSNRKRDEKFKAELQVLGESVKHHVQEEESTVFGLARKFIDREEREEIGEKWQQAKRRANAGGARKPPARKPAAPKRPSSRAASTSKKKGAARKTSRKVR